MRKKSYFRKLFAVVMVIVLAALIVSCGKQYGGAQPGNVPVAKP
jgi:hypothetical protein